MSQKARYVGQGKLKMKRTIIITIAILMIILTVFLSVLHAINVKNEQKNEAISNGRFNSLQDIFEYYGSEFRKSKESKLDGFELDIYAVFKYSLYDGEKSNEEFYNNILNAIAEFMNYSSFRVIDDSKEEEIEIQVICGNGKIQTIYINGIEDYFIYMDSQMNLKKYKELKNSDISIESEELIRCIQNNWDSNSEFGTREAIFQNYYIYFDEGIETRKIDGKIYNIVFTSKYQKSVVNGFTVGTKHDIIIDKMGEPTFQNEDGSIIGYKNNDIYVFFEKEQISIYRNHTEDGFDEFFSLVDDFLDDKYSFLDFMNELTYIWPDYEQYTYDTETVFISYPNKGIDIKLNYDNTDGIILYNNIGVSQEKVNQYLEHTEFVANLQVDNVFNSEKRRVEQIRAFTKNCEEYQENYEKEDNRNRGQIYNYYMKMASEKIISVYFISQHPDYVNCELSENVDTYVWLNDYCFTYSKKGKGIYFYDLKNQTRGTLITGEDDFKIESYQDGILKYDDKTIQVQY